MNTLRSFRIVALLEGLSFLILLGIAMPLKYVFHEPLAVRLVGGVHGMLFLAFVSTLVAAAWEHGWPLKRSATAFGASLLPFGTFVFDRELREEMAALQAASPKA